jgi:hypothetical protein
VVQDAYEEAACRLEQCVQIMAGEWEVPLSSSPLKTAPGQLGVQPGAAMQHATAALIDELSMAKEQVRAYLKHLKGC